MNRTRRLGLSAAGAVLTGLALYLLVRREPADHRASTEPPATEQARESSSGTPTPPAPSSEPVERAGDEVSARSDDAFNEKIRGSLSDPRRVIELVEQARRRYPDSEHAAEWSKHRVDALVAIDDYRSARREAEWMVDEFRGTRWARDVEASIGAHPRTPASSAPTQP